MTASETGPTDAHLVALVLTADREAFAAVYDRYGPRLYDFAYSMLRHPEDAADTVADSFVLFAERLPQLREPDRLRPWLYAIVRSECLRRLKARKRFVYGDDEQLNAMADDAKTPEEEAETAALRTLVWDAAAGLADRDRALLDLHLRQGLEGAELGEAMGVTAANAYVMVNRLKTQVDRSLGALLIARLGRDECDELDDLLLEWDGTFSPLIRKRVARHIDNCDICSERRKKIVSPWMLLATVPAFTAPLALRDRVLADTRLVAYSGPGQLSVVTPVGTAGTAASRRSRSAKVLAGAAVLALIVGGSAAALWPDDKDSTPAGQPVATASDAVPPLTSDGPTLTALPSPGSTATPAATPAATPTPSESPSAAPGTITVSAGSFDLGLATGPRRAFRVTNTGGQPIAFRLADRAAWLSTAASDRTLNPGQTADVTARAARSLLAEGTSAGSVDVSWDGGRASVRITVRQENDPVVGRPNVPPDSSCDNVPVSVRVADESRLSSVRLTWSGPSGTGSAAMTRSGALWRTTAGPFPVGGPVTFRVTATDVRGNRSTGPALRTNVNPCPG